jgi:hypothetical protein
MSYYGEVIKNASRVPSYKRRAPSQEKKCEKKR